MADWLYDMGSDCKRSHPIVNFQWAARVDHTGLVRGLHRLFPGASIGMNSFAQRAVGVVVQRHVEMRPLRTEVSAILAPHSAGETENMQSARRGGWGDGLVDRNNMADLVETVGQRVDRGAREEEGEGIAVRAQREVARWCLLDGASQTWSSVSVVQPFRDSKCHFPLAASLLRIARSSRQVVAVTCRNSKNESA